MADSGAAVCCDRSQHNTVHEAALLLLLVLLLDAHDGVTLLHKAASGNQCKVVELVLAVGAHVNEHDRSLCSLTLLVVLVGDTE